MMRASHLRPQQHQRSTHLVLTPPLPTSNPREKHTPTRPQNHPLPTDHVYPAWNWCITTIPALAPEKAGGVYRFWGMVVGSGKEGVWGPFCDPPYMYFANLHRFSAITHMTTMRGLSQHPSLILPIPRPEQTRLTTRAPLRSTTTTLPMVHQKNQRNP
jgi:hypothetical protein